MNKWVGGYVTQNWALHRGYTNPHWCLIHRCLGQVAQQEARMVLITSWQITQPWFLYSGSGNASCLLPNIPDLVILPAGKQFITAQGAPQLIAWPTPVTFSSQRLSLMALKFLLSSWRSKTNQSYNSLCSK